MKIIKGKLNQIIKIFSNKTMVDEKPFNAHYLMQYIKENNNLIILNSEV